VLEVGVVPELAAGAVTSSSGGTFAVSRLTLVRGLPDSASVGSDIGNEGSWAPVNVRRVQDEDGMIGDVFSLLGVDFGGHSRFSFTSSFVESLVIFDKTLVLRGDADGGGNDCRLV
jgi:hypothetical protein